MVLVDSEQWIHMIGICGSGMSGIAKILRDQGFVVTGSDLHLNGTANSLSAMGIKLWEGHSASHIVDGIDLVVKSSAIKDDNPEVVKALAMGLPVIKRGDMLAVLHNQARGIAVAGAHGKTTTSSMLAVMLSDAGLDPTFVVGGELKGTDINSHWGKGSYFVCEADESDGSFLALNPEIAVVTNVEEDHLDHYQSRDRLEEAFKRFLAGVKPGGFAVLWGGDHFLTRLTPEKDVTFFYYGEGEENNDYYFTNLEFDGPRSFFDVMFKGRRLGSISLSIPGKHNVLNALAAIAVGHQIGIPWGSMAKTMAKFKGAKRRLEITGQAGGVIIIDDYAHHPTEVEATIKAVRQFHSGRLLVVFQPHRYSRTASLGPNFGPAFKDSDLLVVTDVYAAGEKPIPGVSGQIIYESALKTGVEAVYIPEKKDIVPYLLEQIKSSDLVLTVGAGDIWEVGVELNRQLVNLFRV